MRRIARLWAVAAVSLPVIGLWIGCGPARPADDAAAERAAVEAQLAAVREAQEAPGAILGVRRGDGSIELFADGLADVEAGRPMAVDHPFQLGSISKLYTAVVVLQLADEGLLALDDPLSRFVPELPGGDGITLRQLLHHTSGLEDFAVYLYFRPRAEMMEALTRRWTTAELLALAARLEPQLAPGERWSYSNTNYFLLALVVERATGKPFAGELRRRIFEPLGLETTWLAQYESPRAPLAVTGYLGPLPFWPASEMFGELGPTTELDQTNIEWGAGGVISTSEESLRFLAAVLDPGDERILSPAGRAAMQSFHPSIPLGRPPGSDLAGIEAGYGLGLVREVAPDYERLGHGGMFNGHAAGLFHFPRCDLSVALFVNRGFVQLLAMYHQLLPTLGCPPADAGPRAGEAAATPLE